MSQKIAIIPARGGSKRIPGKNKRDCAGKPLIAWTIEAAINANIFDRIVVSTDDSAILKIAKQYSPVYPYKRPSSLAEDNTTMIPVLQDIFKNLDCKDDDSFILLQPTSPLRLPQHIQEAWQKFEAQHIADTLVSVMRCPKRFHPQKLLRKENGTLIPYFGHAPSQGEIANLDKAYGRNGPAILIMRGSIIKSGKMYGTHVLPYLMEEKHSLDIDEEWDFELADILLKAGII